MHIHSCKCFMCKWTYVCRWTDACARGHPEDIRCYAPRAPCMKIGHTWEIGADGECGVPWSEQTQEDTLHISLMCRSKLISIMDTCGGHDHRKPWWKWWRDWREASGTSRRGRRVEWEWGDLQWRITPFLKTMKLILKISNNKTKLK